jgi:hypothetical protein
MPLAGNRDEHEPSIVNDFMSAVAVHPRQRDKKTRCMQHAAKCPTE